MASLGWSKRNLSAVSVAFQPWSTERGRWSLSERDGAAETALVSDSDISTPG